MPLLFVFAPIADRALARSAARFSARPMPADPTRQTTTGPSPDRLLVAGGGIALGVGVRSHALALPGRLAETLPVLTGRGAQVDIATQPGLRVSQVLELLAQRRIEHYDALVLTLGAADAYRVTPLGRWRSGLERLLDDLASRMGEGSTVVLTSAAPVPRPFAAKSPLLHARDVHAARLDVVTEAVAALRGDVRFVRTAEQGLSIGWNSAFDYDRLARRLAPLLSERLDALASAAPPRSARRLRASSDPELLRQAALERTRLLGASGDENLERLLKNLADRMGVRAAAVTLIDGDVQRIHSVVGSDRDDLPRSIAMCNHTIRKDVAHVEPDLLGHPLAERGWRFYAGFPIESPDGYRIGAVCLLDELPRQGATVDTAMLEDLATRVQNELWVEIRQRRAADAGDPAANATLANSRLRPLTSE